jgi:hypothetical protein
MRYHRRIIRRRLRGLALGLAAMALLAPAGASAQPARDVGTSPPQAKVGDTPADFALGARWTALADHYASLDAAKAGDTPADYPGASRAPQYDPPTTIEVVRPERTVIRDTDDALPIVLAGLAVLIALGGTGSVLVRTRSVQRRPTA